MGTGDAGLGPTRDGDGGWTHKLWRGGMLLGGRWGEGSGPKPPRGQGPSRSPVSIPLSPGARLCLQVPPRASPASGTQTPQPWPHRGASLSLPLGTTNVSLQQPPSFPSHPLPGFGLFWVILVFNSAPSALLEQKKSINAASRARLRELPPAGRGKVGKRPPRPPRHKVLAQAGMLGGSQGAALGHSRSPEDRAPPAPSTEGGAGRARGLLTPSKSPARTWWMTAPCPRGRDRAVTHGDAFHSPSRQGAGKTSFP